MPRKTEEEIQEQPQQAEQQTKQQENVKVLEVPITLELLNNKLNHLITIVEQLRAK